MNLEVRQVGRLSVVYHKECGNQVHLGAYRVVFCKTCRVTEDFSRPEKVLCCTECDKPLAVIEGRGSYCLSCDYHPSMQDTFFQAIS